jgi:hypothetical protein
MSVRNGGYECVCYHALFVLNQFGDLERWISYLLNRPTGRPTVSRLRFVALDQESRNSESGKPSLTASSLETGQELRNLSSRMEEGTQPLRPGLPVHEGFDTSASHAGANALRRTSRTRFGSSPFARTCASTSS